MVYPNLYLKVNSVWGSKQANVAAEQEQVCDVTRCKSMQGFDKFSFSEFDLLTGSWCKKMKISVTQS